MRGCYLTCPICSDPLTQIDHSLRCPAGHSFDLAREGYVNLIPAQHRPRGHHGDLPEMLRARRRFLDAGHFAPLLDQLTHSVAELLRSSTHNQPGEDATSCIADIGCGEGYYIGGVGRQLRDQHEVSPGLFGMDISRAAVRLAARRYPEATFFVGDINRKVHLPDHSVDCLLNIFAPRNPIEFARILAPRGIALIVIPGPNHLASLRAEFDLLEIQGEKEGLLIDRLSDTFRLIDRTELGYPLQLEPDDVVDLISMGPSHWHRDPNSPLQVGDSPLETEASFTILYFQPIEGE